MVRALAALGLVVRWAERNKAALKIAWAIGKWILPLMAAGGAGWWGLTYWQGDILGYRVKVNKKLPPPETGWEGELREEISKPGKKKP